MNKAFNAKTASPTGSSGSLRFDRSSMQRLAATQSESIVRASLRVSFPSSNDIYFVPCVHLFAIAVVLPYVDQQHSCYGYSPSTSGVGVCYSRRIYIARLCRVKGFSMRPKDSNGVYMIQT